MRVKKSEKNKKKSGEREMYGEVYGAIKKDLEKNERKKSERKFGKNCKEFRFGKCCVSEYLMSSIFFSEFKIPYLRKNNNTLRQIFFSVHLSNSTNSPVMKVPIKEIEDVIIDIVTGSIII